MKAVVLCEDHTLDQFILKPVVEEIFREAGRKVVVEVASNPRIQGIEQLLDPAITAAVIANYRWLADAFFIVVDADCRESQRRAALAHLASVVDFPSLPPFFTIAIQELEVWALALHRSQLKDSFKVVRTECHPKQAYFDPLVAKNGWYVPAGKGRKAAMRILRSKWDSLKALCPEVQQLCDEVKAWLDAQP